MEEMEQVLHLTLVQVLEEVVVLEVAVVVLVRLGIHLPLLVLLVVQENNYLGLYQHGDGEKIILQEDQDKHQLLPIQQDLLVQEENYLGDMDGSQVAAAVEEINLGKLEELVEQVVVMDHIVICLGVVLLTLVVMDMVDGLLLVLVVVEEELDHQVVYHPQLVVQEEVQVQ
jgi:hypothetical protein